MKTKLYFSLASAILFAIAVIVFFINGNPQKWFWLCIFFAFIIQNIVLLKRIKKCIRIFKLLTYLCRLASYIENAFIQFYNKSMFYKSPK